jgi:hypothetical protein
MDMSQPVGSNGDGARSKARDSLFLLGTLTLEGIATPQKIRIRNLSPTGMMAESPILGKAGQTVTLETKGIGRVTGKIAWVVDGRMGIAFDAEVDPQLARQPVAPTLEVPEFLKPAPGRRPGFGKF